MYQEDFYSYDGDLQKATQEVTNFLVEKHPVNPILVIIEQGNSFIHLRVYCDSYD